MIFFLNQRDRIGYFQSNKNFSDTIINSVGNEKPIGFKDNEIIYCKENTNFFDPTVDEICSFCSEATDDLCHYFYDCRLCVHFWNSVKDWLRHKFNIGNIDEYINKQSVILGLFSNVENVSIVNFILLYAKWFIYIKKNNNVHTIDIQEFLHLIRSKLEINVMVARHQNNNILISKMSPSISLLEQPT